MILPSLITDKNCYQGRFLFCSSSRKVLESAKKRELKQALPERDIHSVRIEELTGGKL